KAECLPAEGPMGSARDALQGAQKDSGLTAQQRAIDELQKCIAESDAKKMLEQLQSMLDNMQMARPGQNQDGGDDEMSQMMDELSDMIRKQQQLRDRTFEQGQDQRRQRGQQGQQNQRGQQNQQGQEGQQGDQQMGDLQQEQQALREELNKLLEELKKRGLGQQQGQQGQQ